MVDWSLAAIPTALVVFLLPYVSKFTRNAIWKARTRSRLSLRLKWDDIPEGKIHDCSFGTEWHLSCFQSLGRHKNVQDCWLSIVKVFNRATNSSRQFEATPESLPLGPQYLCTDAQTLQAFILCTASENDRRSFSRNKNCITYGTTQIDLELFDGMTVAHVTGNISHERENLTKNEVTRILEGWPPWYKEKFISKTGVQVYFPMSSGQDIPRGGWVVAVGLMDSKCQDPFPVFLSPGETVDPGHDLCGIPFGQAVKRCRDHIKKNISPLFPNSRDVFDGLEALNYLIYECTGSGMPWGGLGRDMEIPHLTSSQCRFICEIFNRYGPLEEAEKIRLEPILHRTMSAVVYGACEVIQYLKNAHHGFGLHIPPSLEPWNREVWVRDCRTKLPKK